MSSLKSGLRERLERFLVASSLSDSSAEDALAALCALARGGGLSLSRLSVAWMLLDPLYHAQQLSWDVTRGVANERFAYDPKAEPNYLQSPIAPLVAGAALEVRYRLGTPEADGFAVLREFAARGHTDYLATVVGFRAPLAIRPGSGVVISYASDAPDGFPAEELALLKELTPMIALAARAYLLVGEREAVARAYLGPLGGKRIEEGPFRLGACEAMDAVVWYCDLRSSTALLERLGLADYLPPLNAYFAPTAGPVITAGGDVLDFIGDAVLAVFPDTPSGVRNALRATEDALAALAAFRADHGAALGDGAAVASVSSIAMAERVTFSVIGPTVNRVARIEATAKRLGVPVLASGAVAAHDPTRWAPRGSFVLSGVADPLELFSLASAVEPHAARARQASRA